MTAVSRLLRRLDLYLEPAIKGENENYFVLSDVLGDETKPLDVYIYNDQAGFFSGEAWHIWENQDYSTEADLIRDFLQGLETVIERSR